MHATLEAEPTPLPDPADDDVPTLTRRIDVPPPAPGDLPPVADPTLLDDLAEELRSLRDLEAAARGEGGLPDAAPPRDGFDGEGAGEGGVTKADGEPAAADGVVAQDDPIGPAQPPDPIDAAMTNARCPLAGMSALVIDRSKASRARLHELIEGLGAERIFDADSFEEAAQTLRMQPVHLIVSEYQMRDGSTAQTLMQRLREQALLPLSTMFVVASAERSARMVASVAELAPDAYLIKPLVADDVRSRLARASHRKRALYDLHLAIETRQFDQATQEALRVAERHPPLRSEALRVLTEHLVAAGEHEPAETLIRKALSFAAYPWALYRLAELRFRAERYDDAERLLVGLNTRSPDLLPAYELLARIREIRGRFDEALQSLDQAADRAVQSTGRLRRTASLARRVGDLERAESSYAQVVQRAAAGEPASAEDAVNLVQVLMAQGKSSQARRVSRQQSERHAGHPDASLADAMFEFSRQQAAGRRDAMLEALEAVVRIVESAAEQVSLALGLQALEACVDESARALGYRLALALVRSRRADRPTLNRMRALVDRLAYTPEHLISIADLPLSIERLAAEGWDHHLGPAIAESVEHWLRQAPGDVRLAAIRRELGALARRFGILQYG